MRKTRKINWRKYIPSKKTRSKIKSDLKTGLRATNKYFKNMSKGIDDTMGIPKRKPDYTLTNIRPRYRRGVYVIRRRRRGRY